MEWSDSDEPAESDHTAAVSLEISEETATLADDLLRHFAETASLETAIIVDHSGALVAGISSEADVTIEVVSALVAGASGAMRALVTQLGESGAIESLHLGDERLIYLKEIAQQFVLVAVAESACPAGLVRQRAIEIEVPLAQLLSQVKPEASAPAPTVIAPASPAPALASPEPSPTIHPELADLTNSSPFEAIEVELEDDVSDLAEPEDDFTELEAPFESLELNFESEFPLPPREFGIAAAKAAFTPPPVHNPAPALEAPAEPEPEIEPEPEPEPVAAHEPEIESEPSEIIVPIDLEEPEVVIEPSPPLKSRSSSTRRLPIDSPFEADESDEVEEDEGEQAVADLPPPLPELNDEEEELEIVLSPSPVQAETIQPVKAGWKPYEKPKEIPTPIEEEPVVEALAPAPQEETHPPIVTPQEEAPPTLSPPPPPPPPPPLPATPSVPPVHIDVVAPEEPEPSEEKQPSRRSESILPSVIFEIDSDDAFEEDDEIEQDDPESITKTSRRDLDEDFSDDDDDSEIPSSGPFYF